MHTSEARSVCVPVCVPGVPGVLATTFLTRLCMERIERDVVGVAGVVSAASLWQWMQHPDRGGQRVHRVLVGQPSRFTTRVTSNKRKLTLSGVAMLCAFLWPVEALSAPITYIRPATRRERPSYRRSI